MIVVSPPSLKSRALRLLSTREYSRTELEKKLAPFEAVEGTLGKALDELQAKGFINEQRVLESVLHRRANKLGTMRIRQELESKGLAPEAVLDAVELLRSTELERARAVWEKKFGKSEKSTASNPAERAKQMRFLATRGFSGDAIRKLIPSFTAVHDMNDQ